MYISAFSPFYMIYVSCFRLMSRGRERTAAWTLISGILGLQVLGNLFNPGVADQALGSFINLILIAGFTLHRRAAILTAFLAALGIASYMYLEGSSLLPPPLFEPTIIERIPLVSLTVLTTGGLVTIALFHMSTALDRERKATQDAKESSTSLRRALDEQALRGRLDHHLVLLGQQFLTTRDTRQQLTFLVETCLAVESVTRVLIQSTEGQVDIERGEARASGEPVFATAIIHGPHRERILCVEGKANLVRSPSFSVFLNTAAGLTTEAAARATAETQLKQAEQMQAIGHLAAGVAHDFNNLLAAIMGNVEIAEYRIKAEQPIQDDLKSIRLATTRAYGLTQKMLALNDSQELERTPTAIAPCIHDLTIIFRQTIPERIQLRVATPIPDISALVDRVELEQILLNLVNNARDAIPDHGTIDLAVEFDEDQSGDVIIRISDTGVGMPQETIAQIFNPFFTTRKGIGGHGLGLTSVRTLVKRLNGSIEVQSTPGEGTTFTVCLPTQATIPTTEDDPEHLIPPSPTDASTSTSPLRGREVLFVEDDQYLRKAVAALLTGLGATVHTADSGEHALVLMEDQKGFDLLLSDVRMPGMDGHELLRRLRQRGHQFPAILTSGYEPQQPSDSESLEPFRRLPKPFTRQQLGDVLTDIMPPCPASLASADP